MIRRQKTGLSSLFPAEAGRRVAIVGAGGKTSTLQRLSRKDADCGYSVLNLTTTKMYFDQPPGEALAGPEDTVPSGSVRYYGRSGDEDDSREVARSKFLPPTDDELANLLENPPSDRVLIEADGARQGWVKLHREYEPVVPDSTDALLAVINLRGVGRRPSEEWIHRWPDWCRHYHPEETVRFGHLEDLLQRDHGYQAATDRKRWLLFVGSPSPGSKIVETSLAKGFTREFWLRWDRIGWWKGEDVSRLVPVRSRLLD